MFDILFPLSIWWGLTFAVDYSTILGYVFTILHVFPATSLLEYYGSVHFIYSYISIFPWVQIPVSSVLHHYCLHHLFSRICYLFLYSWTWTYAFYVLFSLLGNRLFCTLKIYTVTIGKHYIKKCHIHNSFILRDHVPRVWWANTLEEKLSYDNINAWSSAS